MRTIAIDRQHLIAHGHHDELETGNVGRGDADSLNTKIDRRHLIAHSHRDEMETGHVGHGDADSLNMGTIDLVVGQGAVIVIFGSPGNDWMMH
jgi:hypothetical protein